MRDDPGHQQSHQGSHEQVLDALDQGAHRPPVREPRPRQGQAHPASGTQGGGGLRLSSDYQHVSQGEKMDGIIKKTLRLETQC